MAAIGRPPGRLSHSGISAGLWRAFVPRRLRSASSIAWTRDFWGEMQPFSRGGAYPKFPGQGEEAEALLRVPYGDANYKRLVEIKTKYDLKTPSGSTRTSSGGPGERFGHQGKRPQI